MIGLAALWCIWGPVRLAARLTLLAGVTAALNAIWLAGYFVATLMDGPGGHPSFDHDLLLGNAVFLLSLPGVILAAAVPPWVLRLLFGFRLMHSSDDTAKSSRGSFSIGSVMAVTALIAAAMATTRMNLTINDTAPPSQQMLSFAVAWAWAAGVGLVSLVPAVLMILWPRRWAVSCVLVSVYFLVAAVVIFFLLGNSTGALIFYTQLLSIFTIALILPLLYARWIGYRLVRRA